MQPEEQYVALKKDGVLIAHVKRPSDAFSLAGVCHDVRDLVYLFMKNKTNETSHLHKFCFVLDGIRAERVSFYNWEWIKKDA